MKKHYAVLSLFILGLFFDADAQQTKWLIPDKHYNMTNAVPSILTGLPAAEGEVSQSIFDENGNLLFYIIDLKVYSTWGTHVATLPTYYTGYYPTDPSGTGFHQLLPSMAIVPVPRKCNKYYVIYALSGVGYGDGVFSAILDNSTGIPALDTSGTTATDPFTGYYPTGHRNPKWISAGSTFAITKPLNIYTEPYLFTIDLTGVKRNGIASEGIVYFNEVLLVSGSSYNSTLALSPDQKYLAFGNHSSQKIYQIELYPNYTYKSHKVVDIDFWEAKGLEYDSTSTYLFANGPGSGTNGGIYWIDATTFTAFSKMTATGASNCTSSLMRLAKNGNIYLANDNGKLSYINTSNMPNPTLTTTGINVPEHPYEFHSLFLKYTLPYQISGQDYSYFSSYAKTTADFKIDGVDISSNIPPNFLNTYMCDPLMLNNLSTNVNQYLLQVRSTDATGAVISGSGYLSYSSGWVTGNPGSINLKGLYGGWLASPANAGYYKIELRTRNGCNQTSTKEAYINLNAPPSAAIINVQVNAPVGGIPCKENSDPTVCEVGPYSASYNLGGSGSTFDMNNISSYSRKLEEVDCNTGSVISLLYEDTDPVIPTNPNGSLIAISFINDIPITPNTGVVFAANSEHCYKFSVTATNPCSSSTDFTYFWISDTYSAPKPSGIKDSLNDGNISIFPNPANDVLKISYGNFQNEQVSVNVYDLQGRLLLKGESIVDKTTRIISTDIKSLLSGMYIFKLYIGGDLITGRFVKL